ncbi:MAG: hypothetical protein Q7P63_02110 [Verrucomicrobiota bacterium JB022]|nr:hypothetical protein [Verrucomicrobiota bacterium JB022]
MRFDVVSDAGTAWIVAARKTYLDDEAFFYWTEATGYVRMDIQDNLITTNFEISDDGKTILHTTKPGLPSSNGRYYYSIYKLNEAGGWDVFAPNSVAHSVNHDGSNIIFSADFGEHTRYEWKKGMYREVPEWVWRSVTRDITAIDLGDHLPHWVFAGEEEPRPFSGFRGRIATNQGSHGIINMSASSARAAIVIGNALTHTGAQVPVIWENGKILNLLNEVEDHEGLDYISNFHVHNTSLDGSTIWGSLWQDGAYRPWVIYDYTFPVLMPDLEAAVLNETTLRLSWHAQPSVRHVLQGRNIDGTWTDLETIDHSATEASLYQRDVSLNSYGYYRIVASRL